MSRLIAFFQVQMAANLITRLLPIQHHEVSSTPDMHPMWIWHSVHACPAGPSCGSGLWCPGLQFGRIFRPQSP